MPFDGSAYDDRLTRQLKYIASHFLGTDEPFSYRIPLRRGKNDKLYAWEPEESLLFANPAGFIGSYERLNSIDGFSVLPGRTRNFSYVTFALPGPDKYTARMRCDFFNCHINGKVPDMPFSRYPSDITMGFKSLGMSRLRAEFETNPLKDFNVQTALAKLKEKYNEHLPTAIKNLQPRHVFARGVMGAQRAGFEGVHKLKDGIHKHVVWYPGSNDACNTARPDFAPIVNFEGEPFMIAGQRFEMELEAKKVFSNVRMSDDDCARIIEASLDELWPQVQTAYADAPVLGSDDPRTYWNKTQQALENVRSSISAYPPANKIKPSQCSPTQLTQLFNGDARYPKLPNPKDIHIFAGMPVGSLELLG